MDAVDGHSPLLAALGASVCRDADVEFAVAFGSVVTGNERPSSDLDVAVKFTDDLSPKDRFEKRCLLSGTLQRADAPYVDIADLEALPVDVAHGEFLCGDERAFHRYTAGLEEAFDARRDEIRRHQRDVIDRIAEGGLGG